MSVSARAAATVGGLFMLIAASGGPGADSSGHTTGQVGTGQPRLAATFPRTEPGQMETRRIQGHLLDVERALRGRATGALSAAQRERRNTALNWLREYRERGRYPHNHTHAGGRVPVFVDEHGTPCAVAYLLQRSGRESLVREIASADNNVYAWKLAGDPRFSEWLDETGLTLEDAARIQPNYADRLCCTIVKPPSRAWRYVAPLSVGSALVTHVARPEGWARPVLGAINGAFALAHAAFAVDALDKRSMEEAQFSAGANTALAFVSGYVAWSLLRPRPDQPSTSGAGIETRSLLKSQRPRLLAPAPAWVGGGVGLQVRLVH
ncbi:hypothetical protein [Candidatus Palauibacter sp.]|uniref:hypothetical protein n=1 Tax=Candidatus Palauibacter sp. TaxID=3101350 RepID=UPI003B58F267